MNNKLKLQESKGFALVFAIFLTIGIEMMILGNMLSTMRETRETQRLASEARLQTIADSVIDRTLLLFKEYVQGKNRFPATDQNGRVLGNDFIGADNQAFNVFLSNWYNGEFSGKFSQDLYTRLGHHVVSPEDITIIETEKGAGDRYRKYSIAVTVHSDTASTHKRLTQNLKMTRGQMFDFSIFSDESLEFTAGPSWRVQGPIFSNQDIFMMNDQDSTLTLVRAKNFSDPHNPEPYVMKSAAGINFGFKRVHAKNYALEFPNYKNRVSYDYWDPSDPALPSGEKGYAPQGMEIDRRFKLATTLNPKPATRYVPRNYAFSNGLTIGSQGANSIEVENSAGGLVPLVQNIMSYGQYYYSTQNKWQRSSWIYAEDYRKTGPMNFANNIDDKRYPRLANDWTSKKPTTSSPAVNPNWLTPPVDTVKDSSHGVTSRDLSVGDSANPSGNHLLIEPRTDLFPPIGTQGSVSGSTRATILDNDDVKEQKLQYRADLNLYYTPGSHYRDVEGNVIRTPKEVSDDLKNLIEKGVVEGEVHESQSNGLFGDSSGSSLKKLPVIYDYRETRNFNVIKMDIAKLMEEFSELLSRPEGTLIYIHVYPTGSPAGVQIVNAEMLPKSGLTIATNGRVYVTGDYNTFSYDLPDCDAVERKGNASCYCSSAANVAKWEAENCKVPASAIFSDSLVYLSRDWVNPYGREGLNQPITRDAPTLAAELTVSGDHMYNVAIATGFKPGRLVPTYSQNSFTTSLSNGDYGWSCPDQSYTAGREGVKNNCEYYQNEKGLFFVNRKSDSYVDAVNRGLVDPADPELEIPIFSDVVSPVHTFDKERGNYEILIPAPNMIGAPFYYISSSQEFFGKGGRWVGRQEEVQAGCRDKYCCKSNLIVPCQGVPGNRCVGRTCGGAPGENGASCTGTCAEDLVWCSKTCWDYKPPVEGTYVGNRPDPKLVGPNINALYKAYGSGGIQNLINLQEGWVGYKMRASGTFSAPWTSRELTKDFMNGTTVYYSAPERLYDFNEDLQENPPPGVPSVFSITREGTE